MERKTLINAEPMQHDLFITREFDLPMDLLFRAHTEAELVEQWMGTKVLRLDNHQHGSWRFETTTPDGSFTFGMHGTIHEFVPGKKITRTFQMEQPGFDVQLEFLEFEELPGDKSLLKIQMVFRTAALRDQTLKLPFSYGLNKAHDQLQEIISKIK